MPNSVDPAILTPEQLAEAKAYHRREFQCDLADRTLDISFLAAATFLLAVPLDRALAQLPYGSSLSFRLLSMFVIITLLHVLCSFPLSCYSGHYLEHQFGLSRQSFAGWLGRYAKRHGLNLLLGGLLTWGLYAIIWTTGPRWWWIAAGAYFLLSVLLGQLAPVLILPLFYKIERITDEALGARLSRLADGTGLTIEGVYRMQMSDETAKANAILAGLGPTRRVLMGDTLLEHFTPAEVDVVFAHEIGHHVHKHVPKLIATGLVTSVGGFLICDWALRLWVTHVDGSFTYATLPAYTQPLFTLVTTLYFFLLEPFQNGLSRFFERQADRYALRATQQSAAFRSAFIKLARQNKADPDPHPWEVFLFHSHPPIAARVALAEDLARDSR